MKKIVVEIKEDGECIVEAQGFKGKACLQGTKWVEELLGKVKSRVHKKEYNEVVLEKV